jgi:hypothetical protein
VSGRKIEEAKPATTVTASSALARLRAWAGPSNQLTMTAKAASYSTIAHATPIAAKTAYSCGRFSTRDQASTATAPSSDPAVMRPRPPRASSRRPTSGAQSAATRIDRVSATAIWALVACRSRAIGARKTEKA